MYTYEDLKSEFRIDDWRGDPWGTAYSWLFRIADSITFHHECDPPEAWKFHHSPIGRSDDPAEDSIAAMFDNTDPADLERFGNVLSRYIDKLKRAGKDY